MKKTICLVTNWYPTKENPIKGRFFREQAIAVKDEFDFLVIHYHEHRKKNVSQRMTVKLQNKEENILEYSIDVYIPFFLYRIEPIINQFLGMIRKKDDTKDRRKEFTRKSIAEAVSLIRRNIDAFYCVDAQKEAFLLECLAEYYHKPYIIGEHAPFPWPGKLVTDANKHAMEKADMFMAISNDKIRQILLQDIHLPETVYIGNLVDETQFTLKKKNNHSVKTFIIVASHSYYKNYDMFIDVMNRLTKITRENFRVMIVGYGANEGYAKDIEEFENQIKNSDFSDKVTMIYSVPHEKMGEILQQADAFVMTSIQEGQPVSAMEAACCGLPIFSTRCGGVEDYVDDKLGRIFDITDCEGMACCLKEYLEGAISFDSEYIRERVVEKFGRKAFTEKFAEAFNKVTESPGELK